MAEKAGTGFSTILQAWEEQPWLQPNLTDHATLEAVELTMRLTSFIPPHVLQELSERYGETFQQLDANERWVMACAWHYEVITNDFLSKQVELHPADLTKLLVGLVRSGLLEQKLAGRWTSYRLGPGKPPLPATTGADTQQLALFGQQPSVNTPQVGPIIPQVGPIIPQVDYALLVELARPVREKQPRQVVVDEVIVRLCQGHYLTANQLAELLGRTADSLRDRYLGRLVASGWLQLFHPSKPRSKNQAYRTVSPS